ncbi:Acyl transferase/acyl hydrolase/lysophospholipase [Penicillium concentricum]|uniref:Acyl transferase/acyl hydrolase/lysophospholipase n=1 Tax=Penicillium concentricum TaxID=293559 RepID=A0A9W9VM35_9EURO|nr:Acyl transferase/acyl hydrolase/lysophospholipase [Penicillium concentricum]KAJ5385629.1 Acyl transferase/acyl hydrolase/lysophospholipase [Penicillium concentricum]
MYHAITNAGLTIGNVASNDVSVFIGISPSILSNRISWFFDFKGISITIDTACWSSLVAFHLAYQDLRLGNSNIAIISGVNLIDDPDMMYRMSHVGFLSPDSICYSLNHRANRYARGEGVGTLILKSVSDAIRDGDIIRAVHIGSWLHTPRTAYTQCLCQVIAENRKKLDISRLTVRGHRLVISSRLARWGTFRSHGKI